MKNEIIVNNNNTNEVIKVIDKYTTFTECKRNINEFATDTVVSINEIDDLYAKYKIAYKKVSNGSNTVGKYRIMLNNSSLNISTRFKCYIVYSNDIDYEYIMKNSKYINCGVFAYKNVNNDNARKNVVVICANNKVLNDTLKLFAVNNHKTVKNHELVQTN